ncbi:hypothetical protein GCM10027290_55000 [Micromonospora sonneratiae]|uniref:non-specific serine/threonine protein kinase n=1 Tax=Micromonospora sonneratiae TaxID=1184706 RepID=A0ABW3YJD7_9ACTN
MDITAGGVVIGPKVLANGPVATVHAGHLANTDTEVAVKMFADRFDRDTTARLDRERQALNSVRSVHSILLVDGLVDHPDGRSGVRMELCPGSLAGLLNAGDAALAVSEVLSIGLTVATALAAAHRVGVVHGGVTPHNVLYRRSGEFVLADFGLALRERFPRDPMHALEYTAPETLRDDTRSTASDLYGLGAVLYAALTGAPPFPRRLGQAPGERILRVLREQVPPIHRAGVPAELSDVIGRLLAKDPADRPPDAVGVATLFEELHRAMSAPQADQQALPGQVPATAPTGPDRDEPTSSDDAGDLPGDKQGDVDGSVDLDDFDFDDFAGLAGSQPSGPEPDRSSQPNASDAPDVPPTPTVAASPAVPDAALPDAAAPAPASRVLVYTTGGSDPAGRSKQVRTRWRPALLFGLGAIVVGLTVVPMLLRQDGPKQPAAPPTVTEGPAQAPAAAQPPQVNLELAPPVDRNSHVELTWRADGDLDFAVVVAGERIDTMVLVANRQRTMRVPVDPTRKYCFQVRATDGRHIYTTEPIPIRGARCKL